MYVGTLWQAPSAMSFGPGQHPGGFGYLLFELRMWVCGEQDEATAEGGVWGEDRDRDRRSLRDNRMIFRTWGVSVLLYCGPRR